MARKAAQQQRESGAPAGPPHQCGIRILRSARAGQVLGAGECAFVTYVFTTAAGIIAGVVAPPVGVYFGPGERVPANLPAGNPISKYGFAGGVVFVNC
jgi:hypothetical protein